MSKFGYLADGELNSKYLLELLQDYLNKLLNANDTNGIVEDDYKINTNSNRFSRWFKHTFKTIGFKFKDKAIKQNYDKVLTVKYVNNILNKIDIFMQTNVLQPEQIVELKSTLSAIGFDIVLPIIDENRENAIRLSERRFFKTLNDVKYLKNAKSNYVLYNSPVEDIKPFLTDEVSIHTIDYVEIQKLIRQFVDFKYAELNNFDNLYYEPKFKTQLQDFYDYRITDNGVGEEVEGFIRSKMLEKVELHNQEQILPEDIQNKIDEIDAVLKRLKINKIEQMMQTLIRLKYNVACIKEVMDKCKDLINFSTIPNKAHIFLVMDNLYYKASKKCELLEQKTKLKLQLVDKQKMFNTLDMIQNPEKYVKGKRVRLEEDEFETLPRAAKKNSSSASKKVGITENLYDDDEASEIHISEDDGADDSDDEIVIDDNK